jgi:hypothetical protein
MFSPIGSVAHNQLFSLLEETPVLKMNGHLLSEQLQEDTVCLRLRSKLIQQMLD